MKFQLEVYQDNAASHAANISHIRVTVLTKTVRDEFNSVTYVVPNTTHLIRNIYKFIHQVVQYMQEYKYKYKNHKEDRQSR